MGKNATVKVGGVSAEGKAQLSPQLAGTIQLERKSKLYGLLHWLMHNDPTMELPSGGYQCIWIGCQQKATIRAHVQHSESCPWILAGKEWESLGEP